MSRIIETPENLKSIVTQRSLLARIAEPDTDTRQEDWQLLFTRYAPAMHKYVHAILRRSLKRHVEVTEAEDLVQDFFATCLEKGWFAAHPKDLRCFRAYLQTQLKRFVYKALDHRFAQKRDPGALAPLEALEGHAASHPDPSDTALDEGWVEVAAELSLRAMRGTNEDYAEVIADLLRTGGEGSEDLAERLGKTPQQVVHLRHRARKRFASLFHEHLRDTVTDEYAFQDLCARLAPYFP